MADDFSQRYSDLLEGSYADMNRPRTRTALAAVLALASSPTGFTVAELTTKARAMTGQTPSDYTVRQAA